MTADVAAVATTQWRGRDLLDGAQARRGAVVREAAQHVVLTPAVRVFCRPLIIEGEAASQPAVYVANHASHADTAAVRAVIGSAARRRLAVAAAEDYFFTTPARAVAFTLCVGAFPFPRSGDAGLRRAGELLDAGWSVLLYPQGTRSDGSSYRPGALRLAADGWPVIPVGIAGTEAVLPKGADRPRRSPTAVVFGNPIEPRALTGDGAMNVFADAITEVASRAQCRIAG